MYTVEGRPDIRFRIKSGGFDENLGCNLYEVGGGYFRRINGRNYRYL